MIKYSFCTTCANRAHQLWQTFDHNAALIAKYPFCEWVILDCASSDGLADGIHSRLRQCSNRIVYARSEAPHPWHASIAKNAAHRLGVGEFLINLDCDNLIGPAIPILEKYTSLGCEVIHLWSERHRDGTFGRIAISRDLFRRLGGYDETFYPMGYQDRDLLERASVAGNCVTRAWSDATLAIPNTKEESILNCGGDRDHWRNFDDANRIRSKKNISAGRLIANAEHGWSALHVTISRGDEPASAGGYAT